jgi:hypothetical protein
MSTNFPGSLDSYSTKVDFVDDVQADHINDLQDALVAIETELGANLANIIKKSLVTAKGNLIVATASGAVSALSVGSNNQVLTADSSQASGVKWAAPSGGGAKNALINGSFAVWQRQIPGTATERADDAYGPDRWYVLTESNPVDTKRIDGNTQRYSGEVIQKNATAQRIGIAQIIEGVNCRNLRGKEVTLSFRARLSSAGTLRFAILEWTGTEDTVTSDVVSTWAGDITSWATNITANKSSQALSANTWTDCSYTVTLGSSFNNLVIFIWSDSQLAQNATLDIEAAQLIQGATAGNFSENIADELARCLRYYEKSYNDAVAPGTSGGVGSVIDTIASSNKSYSPVINLFAQKRVTPTITFYSLSGGLAGKISEYNTGGSLVQNLDGNAAPGEKNFFYYSSGGTPTIGNTFRFHYTAEAEL